MRKTILLCALVMLISINITGASKIVTNSPLSQAEETQFLLAEIAAKGEVNIRQIDTEIYSQHEFQLAELSAQGYVNIVVDHQAP